VRPIYACLALLVLNAVEQDDPTCPPGTVPKDERGAEPAVTCMTEQGVRHGPYRRRTEAGVLVAQGQFDEGAAAGLWRTWYSNRARHEEGRYLAGKPDGWWTRWHPNSRQSEEGEYRQGEEVGVWRAWDEQGVLVSEIPRDLVCPAGSTSHGEAPFIDGFPPIHGLRDGRHCRRSDEVAQGPTVAWGFGRRKIAMVGWYCDGAAQGTWSFFWPAGALAREGVFVGSSRKQGTWTDSDEAGRKILEVDYDDGREVARRSFPSSVETPAPDRDGWQALARRRFDEAMRRPCGAQALMPEPYRGLRAELRPAAALLRVRVTDVRTLDRPPGWIAEMAPPPEEVTVLVKKVLAGSLARPGQTVQLSFAPARLYRRFEELHNYGPEAFWNGPHREWDMTAVVQRDGDRLVLRNLLRADDTMRTDALLAEYARLAPLDDRSFRLGLARMIAPRLVLDPRSMLWGGWGRLAIDDWDRLPRAAASDASLRALAQRTHVAVLSRLDRYLQTRNTTLLNLDELPWLIRQLSPDERRGTALRLIRMHDLVSSEVAALSRKGAASARPAAPDEGVSLENVEVLSLMRLDYEILCSLACCLEPETRPSDPYAKDLLDRARTFVARRG
jgi:antitoxin component YwqK of YwqJK toxin-antitoxin module